MASRGSKIALAGTSLFAVTTIVFVHFQQQAEKNVRNPATQPDSQPASQPAACHYYYYCY